jgi:hypothetical protein
MNKPKTQKNMAYLKRKKLGHGLSNDAWNGNDTVIDLLWIKYSTCQTLF